MKIGKYKIKFLQEKFALNVNQAPKHKFHPLWFGAPTVSHHKMFITLICMMNSCFSIIQMSLRKRFLNENPFYFAIKKHGKYVIWQQNNFLFKECIAFSDFSNFADIFVVLNFDCVINFYIQYAWIIRVLLLENGISLFFFLPNPSGKIKEKICIN